MNISKKTQDNIDKAFREGYKQGCIDTKNIALKSFARIEENQKQNLHKYQQTLGIFILILLLILIVYSLVIYT